MEVNNLNWVSMRKRSIEYLISAAITNYNKDASVTHLDSVFKECSDSWIDFLLHRNLKRFVLKQIHLLPKNKFYFWSISKLSVLICKAQTNESSLFSLIFNWLVRLISCQKTFSQLKSNFVHFYLKLSQIKSSSCEKKTWTKHLRENCQFIFIELDLFKTAICWFSFKKKITKWRDLKKVIKKRGNLFFSAIFLTVKSQRFDIDKSSAFYFSCFQRSWQICEEFCQLFFVKDSVKFSLRTWHKIKIKNQSDFKKQKNSKKLMFCFIKTLDELFIKIEFTKKSFWQFFSLLELSCISETILQSFFWKFRLNAFFWIKQKKSLGRICQTLKKKNQI